MPSIIRSLILVLVIAAPISLVTAAPPKVGDLAPAFTLGNLDGKKVLVEEKGAKSLLVLVILRGWPGYQCPICDRQVNDFVSRRDDFAKVGARLVFVYPGPAEKLRDHANEFQAMKGRQWPASFELLLDPDYEMVKTYDLRWVAPKETAYPSTFVVDQKGEVRFAKVSHSHGERTKADEVLSELQRLSSP